MVDTLFILLTTINTLGKQIAFNVKSRRVDDIINIINGLFVFDYSYFYEEMVIKLLLLCGLTRVSRALVGISKKTTKVMSF